MRGQLVKGQCKIFSMICKILSETNWHRLWGRQAAWLIQGEGILSNGIKQNKELWKIHPEDQTLHPRKHWGRILWAT